jgi:hypothetical protein
MGLAQGASNLHQQEENLMNPTIELELGVLTDKQCSHELAKKVAKHAKTHNAIVFGWIHFKRIRIPLIGYPNVSLDDMLNAAADVLNEVPIKILK